MLSAAYGGTRLQRSLAEYNAAAVKGIQPAVRLKAVSLVQRRELEEERAKRVVLRDEDARGGASAGKNAV